MNAEILPESRHAEWDEFVQMRPTGHLFLCSWWHRALGTVPEVRVVRATNGSICAGVALHRKSLLTWQAIGRPLLTPYNHPLVDEAHLCDATRRLGAVESLLEGLRSLSLIDFVFRHGTCDSDLPYERFGYWSEQRPTYVIDASSRANWASRLSRSHRRYLRKARESAGREKWSVTAHGNADEGWELFRATARARSFRWHASREDFRSFIGVLAERKAGEIWFLRDVSGSPRSCALLVRDRRFAYYLGGGLHPDNRRDFRGNYVLFEAMIQDTLERGLGFDFEGSVLPGVAQFFRGWGGTLRWNARWIRTPSVFVRAVWSAIRFWRSHRESPPVNASPDQE